MMEQMSVEQAGRTNLSWRRASVSAAFAVALTLTFASGLHAQGVPLPCSMNNAPGVECTPVMNMPMYYPLLNFNYSGWSNVTYQSTAAPLPLLSVEGTPTYFSVVTPTGVVNYPVLGNAQQVGNFGPAVFGNAKILANVNTQGVLSSQAAHNACAPVAADAADFCVTGYVDATNPVPTVLLKGSVLAFQSSRTQPRAYSLDTHQPCVAGASNCYMFDFFEFQIHLTGGLLKTPTNYPGDVVIIDVASIRSDLAGAILPTHCDTACVPVTTFTGTFSTDFRGYNISGTAGSTDPVGFGNDLCNGTISGSVRDGASSPIGGVDVSLSGGFLGQSLKVQTAADGSFGFTGLCAVAGYNVFAASPPDSAPIDGYPTTVPVTMNWAPAGNTPTPSTVNFRFNFAGLISSNFLTFGQGAWGAKPRGQNAGALLQAYYSIAYGSGPLVIGSTNTVTMTGATAVQNFLPQGGRPWPLPVGAFTDPIMKLGQRRPHNKLGALAGETLALRLNVDFSNANLTRPGLGALYVQVGPFKGQTVNYVLDLANKVLGGSMLPPAGMNYDTVEDGAELINKAFEGGRDRGFLKP